MRFEVSPGALSGTGERVRSRGTELGNASQVVMLMLAAGAGAAGDAMVAGGLESIAAAWGPTLTQRAVATEALGAQTGRAAGAYVGADSGSMRGGEA